MRTENVCIHFPKQTQEYLVSAKADGLCPVNMLAFDTSSQSFTEIKCVQSIRKGSFKLWDSTYKMKAKNAVIISLQKIKNKQKTAFIQRSQSAL